MHAAIEQHREDIAPLCRRFHVPLLEPKRRYVAFGSWGAKTLECIKFMIPQEIAHKNMNIMSNNKDWKKKFLIRSDFDSSPCKKTMALSGSFGA
jgi:hypothetical protein